MLLLFLLLQKQKEAGLQTSEFCIRCGCAEELRCEGEHGRAVEVGVLTQLFGGEGGFEGSASADDGDVAHCRALEDVEHGRGDVVLCEGCGRGQQHARHVSLADYGDVLRLMGRWRQRTRRVLRVPVDE